MGAAATRRPLVPAPPAFITIMSFCDEKLLKLNERIERPLPSYSQSQINRTRRFPKEAAAAPPPPSSPPRLNAPSNAQREVPNGEEETPASGRRELAGKEAVGKGVLVKREELGEDKKEERKEEKGERGRRGEGSSESEAQGGERGAEREGRNALDCFLPARGKANLSQAPSPFLYSKRVKESVSSDSNPNPSSPLISAAAAQRNKITDYFRYSGGTEPRPVPLSQLSQLAQLAEPLRDFSNANALIKPQREEPFALDRWEIALREKDREIVKLSKALRLKEEERAEFNEKVVKHIAPTMLNLENARRAEKKHYINAEKLRLGEFVAYREGAKFKDVWIDGYELRRLREELRDIAEQKEAIELLKKKFKKRSSRGGAAAADEKLGSNSTGQINQNSTANGINGINGMSGASCLGGGKAAAFFHSPANFGGLCATAELSDSSNPISVLQERNVDEARERLYAQLLLLTREEAHLKEKVELLERQRENYSKIAKQLFEEENCRFGKFNAAEPDKKWPLLSNRYQLLALVGKGGFSEVYRAFDCEEIREVACKIHQLNPAWSETLKSNYIRHALRENQVHRVLSHPNIVTHFDSVEIDSNSFCTVLEFCNGPDLSSFLKRHKQLPEKDAKSIVRQILSALKFLNENDKKIIHYDLKPQNVLFHNGQVKISDFGLCKVMNEDETRLELTSQGVGTYWYLPPECFSNDYPHISTKVDVWSVGVILFELLYGLKPFGNEMSQERILKEGIMLKAYSLEFPARPAVSAETKDFIRKCLEYHQENRVNVFEALALIIK